MTISRLSAGDGYAYYTSVTARGDQHRGANELGDYYLDTGTPQGQWIGRGTDALDVSGVVTERQMKALFGEGLHPNADELMAAKIAAGTTPAKAIDELRLGRKFARYQTPDNELRRRIDAATARHEQHNGQPPAPDERTRIRMREAGIMFRERHGRSGSPQEVAKFLATELSKGQNCVAGFDLTFSAPKSVSIAWAVADPEQAKDLEAAHTAAIEQTITWLEDEVIRARTGAGGIALHTTTGIVGTRFRHWESRDGDPQLHDHVVIANRVQIIDDDGRKRWLTIDSRGLYKATMNASAHYNRALADQLKQRGIPLRVRTTGRHQGIELATVSDRQIERCSTRSAAIQARTDQLAAEYLERHGRPPATKELLQLKQQATLETRTVKTQAVTNEQLRSRWRHQLGPDADTIRDRVTQSVGASTTGAEQPVDTEQVAEQIIEQLSHRQSTWTRNHVETRINMWAAQQPHIVTRATRDQITHAALHQASFCITPEPAVPFHPELRNPDGSSIYTSRANLLYTSRAVLDAEDLLVDAARDIALPAVTEEHFTAALTQQTRQLDPGQAALARDVACSEHVLTVGIGPAGTGKTTALKVAVNAAHLAGAGTHGLAVSAVAADQLQQSTGMPSDTIAKWLRDLDQGKRHINAGDIIIVDEAGMASARDLADITRHATQAGAFIRLIGDDRQLQAIGAGGSIKMLAAEVGATRLDQVWRFTDHDEAQASLRLREHGDVDWYLTHDRLTGGNRPDMLTRITQAWAEDIEQGRSSLMMASTNDDVRTLNQLAQDHRIQTGHVNHTTTVDLADGLTAGQGDRIVTRRNDRRLTLDRGQGFVKNGDLWTITRVTPEGDIHAQDDQGRTVLLPADYARTATQLGYASTVHRAQGRTVDTARILIDNTTTKEALYVGLTRGRDHNHVFAITEGRSAEDLLHAAAATRSSQATSARELLQQAQDEASHPATLARILRDMHQRADHHRFTATIRRTCPDHAEQILDSDRIHRLHQALRDAEEAGFSPHRILHLTSSDLPETTTDPAGLIAWRIRRHLRRARQLTINPPDRPLQQVPLALLDQYLDTASRRQELTRDVVNLHAARPAHLPDGTDVPAWTHRPHGGLHATELANKLEQTRTRSRLASRAIRETLTERRVRQRQLRLLTPGSPTHQHLSRYLDPLNRNITRLRTERRELLRLEQQLRDETRIRIDMDPTDWGRENHQRARRSPWSIPLHEAETLHEQARHIQHQLWLERRWRDHEPDLPPEPSTPSPAPRWAAPTRSLADPTMPTSWITPLKEMTHTLQQAITDRGAALALDPPNWATRYLGPVPHHDAPQRARWEQLAGQIETWRGLTDHTDPDKALPPASRSRAITGTPAAALHTLHAAASDLRLTTIRATSTDTPATGHPRPPQEHADTQLPAKTTEHAAAQPPQQPTPSTPSIDLHAARATLLKPRLEANVQTQHTTRELRDLLHEPFTQPTTEQAARIAKLDAALENDLTNRSIARRATTPLHTLARLEHHIQQLRHDPIREDETLNQRMRQLDNARAQAITLREQLNLPIDPRQHLAITNQRLHAAYTQPLQPGETLADRHATIDAEHATQTRLHQQLGLNTQPQPQPHPTSRRTETDQQQAHPRTQPATPPEPHLRNPNEPLINQIRARAEAAAQRDQQHQRSKQRPNPSRDKDLER